MSKRHGENRLAAKRPRSTRPPSCSCRSARPTRRRCCGTWGRRGAAGRRGHGVDAQHAHANRSSSDGRVRRSGRRPDQPRVGADGYIRKMLTQALGEDRGQQPDRPHPPRRQHSGLDSLKWMEPVPWPT
ncbi:hypothetical protein ACPA9J_12730 [Pseudomonas aeruginosa]